ncbi:hypothetical protein A6V39_03900 [Candidatus Mycoplasma haematobovis]|uniref:Uncharacterized protein n=1 Tax=Candidatus Mycoplasma haematobovis TaxID=432608 RepID=A0A1A9QDE8_9MOLU|nr:hypothetical protein [Candidatus Mycoplasma haematobovis]OAL10031.1 hypothetical protein A6V39_03900 [Candidatus Mycoplasma haematobovis]
MTGIGTKIIIGTLTAGALGGGAYGIYAYNNTTDTVEKYLLDSKLTITKDNEDVAWTKVYDTYLLEKTSSKLEIKDVAINNKNDIKNWCKSKLTQTIKSKEEHLYKQVSKWCVHYTTITDKVGKGKKLVSDVSALNSKFGSLPEYLRNEIGKVVLGSGVSGNTNGEKIKKWCTDNAKRSYVNDSEFYSKNITAHCFVDSSG